MFISLIIPVYNVEKFIERCITSCIEQNIDSQNYEIIIVNDGTQDKSMDIVNSYYRKYPNLIKVYSQENKGLSAARNAGFKIATGDYIWFIDSDDWISENCLKGILTKLTIEEPDILALCAADIVNGSIIRRNTYHDEGSQTGKRAFNNMISPCVPFAIYKRSFLSKNKLYFFEGIYHEDSEFMPRAYYYSKKVSFLNTIVYNVYQNPNSITRTINHKKAFDIITVCKSLNEFSKDITSDCMTHLSFLIAMNLNTALSHSYTMNNELIEKLNNHIYNNRDLFRHLRLSNKSKYRLEYILFNIFSRNTIQVYKFIQFLNNNSKK